MTLHYGVSSAPVQTLGAPFQIEVARTAQELGYSSYWIAEANATEGFAVLGAAAIDLNDKPWTADEFEKLDKANKPNWIALATELNITLD